MTNEEIARGVTNNWVHRWDPEGNIPYTSCDDLSCLVKEALDAKDAQTAPLSKEDEAILKYIEKEVSGARLHGHISISFVDIERLVSLARRGSSPQTFVTDEEIEAKATMIFAHMLPDNISRVTAYNSALELVRWMRSKLFGTEG